MTVNKSMIDKAKLNSILKVCVELVPDWKERQLVQLKNVKSIEDKKIILWFVSHIEEVLDETR